MAISKNITMKFIPLAILIFGFLAFAIVYAYQREKRNGGSHIPIFPINPAPTPKPTNEYVFDRSGYLELAEFVPYPKFTIVMTIKTKSDSFLFGMGYRMYAFHPVIRCWLENGRVNFYVYSGPTENSIIFASRDTITDGKWHKLDVGRIDDYWYIKIDDVLQFSATNRPIYANPSSPLYVGNTAQQDKPTVSPFSGCIKNITINSNNNPSFNVFGTVSHNCGL